MSDEGLKGKLAAVEKWACCGEPARVRAEHRAAGLQAQIEEIRSVLRQEQFDEQLLHDEEIVKTVCDALRRLRNSPSIE